MAESACAAEVGSEDEIEAALDVALAASFLRNPVEPENPASRLDSSPGAARSSSTVVPSARLTFAFPDWAIDICKDAKRRKVSITRHPLPSSAAEADGHIEAKSVGDVAAARSTRKKAWKLEACKAGCGPGSRVWKLEDCEEGASEFGVGGDPGFCKAGSHCQGSEDVEGGPEVVWRGSCDDLPDEILANICKRLSIRDLCSVTETCRRWYAVGLQDELWDALGVKVGPLINCGGNSCPRWTGVKNMTVSDRVIQKFHVYRKGYEFLKCAMNSWWESGKPGGRYNSSGFRGMMRKLTVNNWSLLYEGFGVAFIDRTDYMANLLLADVAVQEEPAHLSSGSSSELRHQAPNARHVKGVVWGADGYKGKWTQFSSPENTDEGRNFNLGVGHAGVSLWGIVARLWKRYKLWLTLVVSHCRELNHEVLAERARSHSILTPTLYDEGVICFRSQIVLRYRIRGLLQSGFNWLRAQDSTGCASDQDVEFLKCVHHLLQELDVHDDFILSPTGYTQEKLRRCFCSDLSIVRKQQKRDLSVLVSGEP